MKILTLLALSVAFLTGCATTKHSCQADRSSEVAVTTKRDYYCKTPDLNEIREEDVVKSHPNE